MKSGQYFHLEACGCVRQTIWATGLAQLLGSTHRYLFSRGFPKQHNVCYLFRDVKGLFVPCLHNSSLLQPSESYFGSALYSVLGEYDIGSRGSLNALVTDSAMGDGEIDRVVSALQPWMRPVFDLWDVYLQNYMLTPVGAAIAVCNIKRLTGREYDLALFV